VREKEERDGKEGARGQSSVMLNASGSEPHRLRKGGRGKKRKKEGGWGDLSCWRQLSLKEEKRRKEKGEDRGAHSPPLGRSLQDPAEGGRKSPRRGREEIVN